MLSLIINELRLIAKVKELSGDDTWEKTWGGLCPPPCHESEHANKRLIAEHTESVALKIPIGAVAIAAVADPASVNPVGDESGVGEATDGMANLARGFLDVLKLHDLALGKAFLEFGDHCGFCAEHDWIDVAMGLGDHERDAHEVCVVCCDDVGGSHVFYCIRGLNIV